MKEKKTFVDEECMELAKHFLDNPANTPNVQNLAETIQQAIEDWFKGHVETKSVKAFCNYPATEHSAECNEFYGRKPQK
jgi:hypothetical protein